MKISAGVSCHPCFSTFFYIIPIDCKLQFSLFWKKKKQLIHTCNFKRKKIARVHLEINQWKDDKPVVHFILNNVWPVTQQTKQRIASLQSTQPLWIIWKFHSWNTCLIVDSNSAISNWEVLISIDAVFMPRTEAVIVYSRWQIITYTVVDKV